MAYGERKENEIPVWVTNLIAFKNEEKSEADLRSEQEGLGSHSKMRP